jgi:hypothetical protein
VKLFAGIVILSILIALLGYYFLPSLSYNSVDRCWKEYFSKEANLQYEYINYQKVLDTTRFCKGKMDLVVKNKACLDSATRTNSFMPYNFWESTFKSRYPKLRFVQEMQDGYEKMCR